MKKLVSKEEALQLKVGDRVLVKLLETNAVDSGVVTIIDESITCIEQYHSKLGIVYTSCTGFDTINDLYETEWDAKKEYCTIYKLEGEELL